MLVFKKYKLNLTVVAHEGGKHGEHVQPLHTDTNTLKHAEKILSVSGIDFAELNKSMKR